MRNVTAFASAFALIAAPTVAAPAFAAPAVNKASSLSVARASTPTAARRRWCTPPTSWATSGRHTR